MENGPDMPDDRRSGAERRTSITVVLVDDEPLIRSVLAHTLSVSGLEIVGDAGSGEDAIELVLDLRPDVVLMDIRLPDMRGVHAIERLGLLAPTSRVLVVARTERTGLSKRSSPAPAATSSRPRHPRRSSPPSLPPPRANRCCPPRLPETARTHPRNRHPDHHQPRRRQRDPRLSHRTRARDLYAPSERQEQSADRTRAVAQHKHRLQPRQEHPRQAPPQEPRPGSRPSSTRRHLLTATH